MKFVKTRTISIVTIWNYYNLFCNYKLIKLSMINFLYLVTERIDYAPATLMFKDDQKYIFENQKEIRVYGIRDIVREFRYADGEKTC